jgi:hypothetical protein
MQCYAVNTKILRFSDFFFEKKVERNFQKWTFLKMSKSEICKKVFFCSSQKWVYGKHCSEGREYFFGRRRKKKFRTFLKCLYILGKDANKNSPKLATEILL